MKLLRFLEAREIRRVGETEPFKSDVRIICATNRDLREMVKADTFREDLFFRLNVITVRTPPLRERPEDVLELQGHGGPVILEALVETGWIAPGTVLTDKKRRIKATVLTDGSLASGADKGSIHSLGAKLQNAPACNGWTFWHLEHQGDLKPVDAIRQLYLLATED